MSSGSLGCKGVAVWLVFGFAGLCHAGPTLLQQAAPGTASGYASSDDRPAVELPSASAPGREGSNSVRIRRDSTPSGSIERVPAFNGIGESFDPVHRNSPSSSPAPDRRGGAGASNEGSRPDDSIVKEVAKSALGWLQDLMPRRDLAPAPAVRADSSTSDIGILPFEAEVEPGKAVLARPDRAEEEAAIARRTTLVTTAAPALRMEAPSADPDTENVLRDAVNMGRDVVSHPLTWLVIVLLGVAHIVVTRARRGKK